MAEVRRRGRSDAARGCPRLLCRAVGGHGQGTLEYAVLIVVVIAALLAMQLYMRRGVAGKLRSSTDDVGEQFSPTAYTGTFETKTGGTTTDTTHVDTQKSGESKSEVTDANDPLATYRKTTADETMTDDQSKDDSFKQ